MLLALADTAWRAALLLALSIAPYAAPVDAAPVTSAGIAALRLVLFVLLALALSLVARLGLRTNKLLGVLALATLLAAVLLPLVFRGDEGPLARGAWFVAPLLWSTLAVLAGQVAAKPLASTFKGESRARLAALVAVAALAIVSMLAGKDRLRPEKVWAEAFAANPGDESAALVVANDQLSAHDPAAARKTLETCVASGARFASRGVTICRCAERAAGLALDAGDGDKAQQDLDATAASCPRTGARLGLAAEAYLMNGKSEDAVRKAKDALELDPNDPHASYALAYEAYTRRDTTAATEYAQKAVDFGRGVPASLLLGLMLFQEQKLDEAKKQFLRAQELDPTNAKVAYDLALVDDKQGRYHDAREGYLKALQLDPKLADARVNLVYLTLGHGVIGEAQHHLEALQASNPDDPRIPGLQAMLAARAQQAQEPPQPPPPQPAPSQAPAPKPPPRAPLPPVPVPR